MSFLQFPPTPENELIDLLLVGDGNYEVLEAAEKMSKSSNNPMIELKMRVWDSEGHDSILFDYLMLTASKFSLRKIRHFCYSCGIGNLYEQGALSAQDCIGKQGKLKIDFKKGDNGYQDKNVVKDYIVDMDAKTETPATGAQSEVFDDDIPF